MKKRLICILLALAALFVPACTQDKDYNLTEKTFFLVMTNMQMYPQQYVGQEISCDCFTYLLTDVHDNEYMCGVRKCSAGYGCTCGQDTIIGFIIKFDGEIPAPKNQSANTNEKTWIHISGKLESAEFKKIEIHSYDANGNVNPNKNEIIPFLEFNVETLSVVEDYSQLNYYVTK